MIIIIEGTEGAGKTRLAEYFARKFNVGVDHYTAPQSDLEKQRMYTDYKNSILRKGIQVWDRCWYSEMVYGPIMRDQSYISIDQMYEFEQLITDNGGGIVIHCTDDVDLLWKRSQERGEDYVMDPTTLMYLAMGYNELFHDKKHLIPVVKYELSKNMPIL